MQYASTRGGVAPVDFTGALLGGLAPDGGLYVPEEFPALPDGWQKWGYVDSIINVLTLFGAPEAGSLVAEAARRFRHPETVPIVPVGERQVLELFWGPTLSFKDHALQVVARLLGRAWGGPGRGKVLVATSGDTGSAAVEACRDVDRLETFVLFPEGRVSDFQRRQMTTVVTDRVHPICVRGTFDDCQHMVKQVFADSGIAGLLSVNSINWARVAVQVGYYVYSTGRLGACDVVVPTGNFGNAYSCWVAQQLGAPVERIIVANNSNRMLSDLINLGIGRMSPVEATVAPAMDIQVPSNLERLTGRRPADFFSAGWASDEEIVATMGQVHRDHGYLLDPHTAAAWRVGGDHLRPDIPQLIAATADPAKFPEVVEKAVGFPPPVPEGFHDLLLREERYVTIDSDSSALMGVIR